MTDTQVLLLIFSPLLALAWLMVALVVLMLVQLLRGKL